MLPRWSERMLYYEDIKVRSKRSGEATSKYTSQALSEPLTRWRAPAPSQVLQEDNDHSHGHAVPKGQTESLVRAYRKANWINIIIHPL